MKSPLYVSLRPFLNHGCLNRPTDWAGIFGNHHPVEVEIGFGNGEYLAALSQQQPSLNFVGFEQYCERIQRTLRKLSRTGLDNVRVLRLDARAGLERYFNQRTISKVYCLYPPPWPKKSDIKHRLFTLDFLKLINSRLTDGGILKIVTDHHPYIEWIKENVPGSGLDADFRKIAANYGTKFEKKWVEGGQKEFYELILTKKEHKNVPLKEDSLLQTYVIEQFNPDNFRFDDYSKEGIAVAFKEIIFDPKKKIGLIHVIACDGSLTQNIRIMVAQSAKGWHIHLAEGSMLMPTQAVSQALECVYQAALKT